MYTSNGIVYAGEPVAGIRVVDAGYLGNHMLLLTFSTGEKRLFDATRLLSMPAFSPLTDEDVLKAFEIDHGVLTWQNGAIDIAPEALYRESFAYEQRA